MAHLLSGIFFFKRIISPNFIRSQNFELTRIRQKKRKCFSNRFPSIKGKKFSKSVNKLYILTKISNFNNGKKYRLAIYQSRKGGTKKYATW